MIVGDFNYNFRHYPSAIIHNKLQDFEFITNLHLDHPHPIEPTPVTSTDSPITPIILDCNDPSNMPPSTQAQWLWHAMLQQYYQECSHRLQPDPSLPGSTGGRHRSTIDYMYEAPPRLTNFLHTSNVEFIGPQWTNHAMLSLHFRMRNTNQGRGLW
ncbi:uncharacterized protein ATC70_005357 [Mucor velutinosus]|uniref:Endonuclease/exonuclease/phosphatase domain-containing protein n=1 Tax=Mucor velutinosus TaxID=708070 RepID=A0AAN7D9I9_9FUNG|nr:hypothetical protein ATC70_005357 [Mucor velutinosus]